MDADIYLLNLERFEQYPYATYFMKERVMVDLVNCDTFIPKEDRKNVSEVMYKLSQFFGFEETKFVTLTKK